MAGTSPGMTEKWGGEVDHGHRRQTGAAAAASPEMAVARQARTGADDDLRGAVLRLLALGNVRHPHAHHRPSLAVAAGSHVDAVHLCDFYRRRRRHPP